jgi:hypothetical protein
MAKKLKNESGLLREALRMVMDDAVKRGIVEFEPGDSHDLKIGLQNGYPTNYRPIMSC